MFYRITIKMKQSVQSPSLITFITLMTIITVVFGVPSQLNSSVVAINDNSWAEILEDWIALQSNNSRAARKVSSRAIKIGDKTVTVSTKISTGNKREVSETDLYLLGAIEKLVYRVDHVEKRLRRAEELLYYIIAGNGKVKKQCPANYTRMGENCYHFSDREFNWKSSASHCRGMGGHLVALDTIEESQDVITGLMSEPKLKGKNFWTGGINPGLLWVWSNTFRPIHSDTKQTVTGDGRCMKLAYNASSNTYSYKDEDCSLRQKYICELTVDDESANKIERTARLLIDKDN